MVSVIRSSIPANEVKAYVPEWDSQAKGLYHVQSQSAETRDTWYLVDILAGVCECIGGRNGKLCNHQKAVVIHNQMNFDRVYNGTASEKRKFGVLALGKESAPSADFWASMHDQESTEEHNDALDPQPSEASSSSNVIVEPSLNQPEPTILLNPELSENTFIRNKQLLQEFCDGLEEKFGSAMYSEETTKALSAAVRNVKRITTAAQATRLCHCFNSSVTYTTSGRKIGVQPSGISRRAPGMPRGSEALPSGRPPKGAPPRRGRRKHNLQFNVDKNQANAKKHH